jgi:hypothetical protein
MDIIRIVYIRAFFQQSHTTLLADTLFHSAFFLVFLLFMGYLPLTLNAIRQKEFPIFGQIHSYLNFIFVPTFCYPGGQKNLK